MDIAQVNVAPDMIHFGVGQPGFDLLPLTQLRSAAAHRLGQGEPDFLNYGLEAGSVPFRRVLAEFLSGSYGTAVSPLTSSSPTASRRRSICSVPC